MEQVNTAIVEALRLLPSAYEWSPQMTSNTNPTPFVASASSVLDTNRQVFHIFDGNDGTEWCSTPNDLSPWVMLDVGNPFTCFALLIKARSFNASPQIMPSKGLIEGSLDGTSWYKIVEFSGIERRDDGRTEQINFPSIASYRYYRISNMDAGYCGMTEIKFLTTVVIGTTT